MSCSTRPLERLPVNATADTPATPARRRAGSSWTLMTVASRQSWGERSISAARRHHPRTPRDQVRQARSRVTTSERTLFATATFSATWKSNMPTTAKSAPFWKAYLNPSFGWIAPAASTL